MTGKSDGTGSLAPAEYTSQRNSGPAPVPAAAAKATVSVPDDGPSSLLVTATAPPSASELQCTRPCGSGGKILGRSYETEASRKATDTPGGSGPRLNATSHRVRVSAAPAMPHARTSVPRTMVLRTRPAN